MSRDVVLAADGTTQAETIFFHAGAAGAKSFEFGLLPLQGEENLKNNALARTVTVSDEKRLELEGKQEAARQQTLSRELAPDHITVNCLAPDSILTDRMRQMASLSGADPEEQIKRMAAATPMGRLGDPAEFGAACAFLCSKQAGYISGQTLGVDGGALLGVH